MVGAIVKDPVQDTAVLDEYLETVLKKRRGYAGYYASLTDRSETMTGQVSYFGIRHHGPGSADSLVQALDDLKPVAVLIEGPLGCIGAAADARRSRKCRRRWRCSCYAEDDPANASFWPFAEFSPEYQAALWAVRHGTALRFIDLPSSDRLGRRPAAASRMRRPASADDDPISRDPIGTLATAAGYDDGESWWSDVIEENPASGPMFAAIADAMTTLRDGRRPLSPPRGHA